MEPLGQVLFPYTDSLAFGHITSQARKDIELWASNDLQKDSNFGLAPEFSAETSHCSPTANSTKTFDCFRCLKCPLVSHMLHVGQS